MAGTSGASRATGGKINRNPRVMFRAKLPVTTTLINTAAGWINPATVKYGYRLRLPSTGLLITMGIGPGSRPGGGLGWTRLHGDLLPITTAAGLSSVAAGAGYPDPMA